MSRSRSPGTGPYARTHLWLSLAEVYPGWLVHMWVLQNPAMATTSWLLLNYVAPPVTALLQYCVAVQYSHYPTAGASACAHTAVAHKLLWLDPHVLTMLDYQPAALHPSPKTPQCIGQGVQCLHPARSTYATGCMALS